VVGRALRRAAVHEHNRQTRRLDRNVSAVEPALFSCKTTTPFGFKKFAILAKKPR
jgi:hypothetical protein